MPAMQICVTPNRQVAKPFRAILNVFSRQALRIPKPGMCEFCGYHKATYTVTAGEPGCIGDSICESCVSSDFEYQTARGFRVILEAC